VSIVFPTTYLSSFLRSPWRERHSTRQVRKVDTTIFAIHSIRVAMRSSLFDETFPYFVTSYQ
jgi:hypothetical protein